MAYTPAPDERTIGQLVADLTSDLRTIVRGEIALAKTEVSGQAKVAGKGAGMLGGAAVAGLFGLGLFLHFLARLIAVWLPVWAGYLIVAVVLFVVAAVLGLMGKKALTQVKPKPEKAIAGAQATKQALVDGAKEGSKPGMHRANVELPATDYGQERAAHEADRAVFEDRTQAMSTVRTDGATAASER